MLSTSRTIIALSTIALFCLGAIAQQPPAPPPTTKLPPPPPANAVAATVNGIPIMEIAVYRAMLGMPAEKIAEARDEVIKFHSENILVDFYLDSIKFTVDKKDVDARLQEIRVEFQKSGNDFGKWLKENHLTQEELYTQTAAIVRFDKFIDKYATDEVLKKVFDADRTMFDGSQMRVRHILFKTPANNPQAAEQAKQRLALIKKQIEDRVNQEMAKVPANVDKLTREKQRQKLLDDQFGAVAAKESTCPSKDQGGDVGWFPRAFRMVEPFAKAAFALRPYQMSDVVSTEFGQHLILATDHKPAAREVKFDEVREIVKEVYTDRVREAIVTREKPKAKIVVNAAPK